MATRLTVHDVMGPLVIGGYLLMALALNLYLLPGNQVVAALYAIPVLLAARFWRPRAVALTGALALVFYLVSANLLRRSSADWAFEAGALVMLGSIAVQLSRQRQAVHHSEARYRELVENANDIIYTHDLAGNFTSLNAAGERISGYTRDEAPRMNVADVVPPECQDLVRGMTDRKVAGETTTTYEVAFLAKDGRRVPVEVSTRLIYEAGKPVGVQGIGRDITERRRAEDARAQLIGEQAARQVAVQHAARLRALHEAALTISSPTPAEPHAAAALLTQIVAGAVTSVAARDGKLVVAEDESWEHLVPRRRSSDRYVAVRHSGQLAREPLRPEGDVAHVLATGEPVFVNDVRLPSRFGPFPAAEKRGVRSFAAFPLRAGGRVLGVLVVDFEEPGELGAEARETLELFAAHAAAALERVRLVHAEQRRAEELARQTQELARRDAEAAALRELDRLKDELLQTITHELRTPLTVVHGYAQQLAARAPSLDPARVAAIAERIRVGSAQLTRLVGDLVEFGRAERGEVTVQPDDFDLAPVLQDLVAELQRQPGGERLRSEFPSRLPVYADPARVTQVVSNLVENALKYAPRGPIVLRARAAAGAEGADGLEAAPDVVRVEVEDHGPGIPAKEQARVWEKFFRGSAVAGLNVARGSGIGLAVVKALVEEQGGRVGLDSTLGRGARFWFELPARRESARGRAATAPARQAQGDHAA